MPTLLKFPSIEQYKNTVKHVQKYLIAKGLESIPPIKYYGTTKLHGSNGAIVLNKDGELYFQSRERILGIGDDNAGFCMWGEQNRDFLRDQLKKWIVAEQIAVYGEWVGPAIQKGVGINKIPNKIFYVFALKFDAVWQHSDVIDFLETKNDFRIVHQDAKPVEITIDFQNPAQYVDQLEKWVADVEAECPIAKFHGIENGVGEGLVFIPADKENRQITDLWFKVKGEKHSVSKTTTGAKTTAVDLTGYMDAVTTFITDARLERGIQFLKESGKDVTVQNTGDFLRFIVNDIIREEREEIIKNNFDTKKLNGMLSQRARDFYIKEASKI